jgi:hypothetical protein
MSQRTRLLMKGHSHLGIYTGPSFVINHSYSFSCIHLFNYPCGFFCSIPNILDVCSLKLNQTGSLHLVSEQV